jgi:hypothetical protein
LHFSFIFSSFAYQKIIPSKLTNMKNNHSGYAIGLVVFWAVIILYSSCDFNEKNKAFTGVKTDSLQQMVSRGKYLTHIVSSCMDCHSNRDFNKYSGPFVEGTEGMGGFAFDQKLDVPGVVYARNITPDTVYGIGKWTDEEIARAITRGISRNGDTLFPVMPYVHFNQMSKEDVYSIIAFLRTLKPNSNKVPARKLLMPVSLAYPPLKSASLEENVKPDVLEMEKYGGYMVNIAACMDCHTSLDKGQFVMSKYLAGGRTFDMGIFKVTSANITPDDETGIGKWTEAMFVEKFKFYRDPATYSANPGKLNTIMPKAGFAHLDEFDMKAIYRYLRTVPAIHNVVEKYPK